MKDNKLKILGIETTTSYVYNKVDNWYNNCGLANKHFINKHELYNMIHSCIKHSKKVTKRLKDNKKNK